MRFSVNLNLMLLDQIGPGEKRILEAVEQSDLAAGERTLVHSCGETAGPRTDLSIRHSRAQCPGTHKNVLITFKKKKVNTVQFGVYILIAMQS